MCVRSWVEGDFLLLKGLTVRVELSVECHQPRKSGRETHHLKLTVSQGTGSLPSTRMSLGPEPVGVTRDCDYGSLSRAGNRSSASREVG